MKISKQNGGKLQLHTVLTGFNASFHYIYAFYVFSKEVYLIKQNEQQIQVEMTWPIFA